MIAVLAEWIGALNSGSFVSEDAGSSPSVPNSSVWDGGQWRDSVSLARVDPDLNGYLEKSGEGKQASITWSGGDLILLHALRSF